MNVYFISGLAADSRVFQHIKLPGGFSAHYLQWVVPFNNDSLQSYALRLASSIDKSKPFVLIGLSLGGMMAVEIAKVHAPKATILLSSIPTYKHLPPHFKVAAHLRLHKIVPVKLLKAISIYKRDFCRDTASDKKVLKQVIRDSDPAFIRWSMNAILTWRNEDIPSPLFHIHGTKDEILPIRFTTPTHTIQMANHLMVMSQASELNIFIKEVLAQF